MALLETYLVNKWEVKESKSLGLPSPKKESYKSMKNAGWWREALPE